MTKLSRHITIWFLLASAILCGLAFATYRSLEALGEHNNWVSHTYEVLIKLDDIMIQLKEVQTSSRGYVITGEARYIEATHSAQQYAQTIEKQLATLVQDNHVQTVRLPQLEEATHGVNAFADNLIRLYDQESSDAAFALIKTGVGQQRIDAARDVIATIRESEHELLAQRRERAERSVLITLLISGAGLAACLAILGLVFALIQRETNRRTQLETTLRHAVAQTEMVNEERRYIAQMGDFLQSCRTPAEAYSLIEQNLPRMFSGSHGALGITSNSRNIIDVVVTWGDEKSTLSQFPPEDCWAMRRGKMHVISAGSHEPDCSHLSARMPAIACLPLMAHGETLGVLYVAALEADYFDDRRQLLLRTVSEQISLALANMKLQDTLRMQTLRDPLTQLFNRRYMESSLERELLRAKRNNQELAVLMLDLDHFKQFNDTFGHDAGDALLKEFSKLLQRNVRGEDIACRYGGEEFILILPTASLDIASKRAEKILIETAALELSHHQQQLTKVTASLGVAIYPHHADDVDMLVKMADKALYRAKREGRNRYVIAT